MKQVNSTTRNPNRIERKETSHYVRVHKDDIDEYLDVESRTNPGELKYTIASDKRADSGHREMVLLECSKEDYDADQAALSAKALRNEALTQDAGDKIDSPRLLTA
jgi:hypothetical protein